MINQKFDFNDVLITPHHLTDIDSRYKQVNPYYTTELSWGKERLPLFTAPMDSVVGLQNMFEFQHNKINVVLPRTEKYKQHAGQFNSFGLKDDLESFDLDEKYGFRYALIDVANGHMRSVINWCVDLKKKHPNVKIMAGNIANPETYKDYANSGVIDYARIGIGNGNGCLTTQQTGVGYPMASLIRECANIKWNNNFTTTIVADGGMKDYPDIIKALSLGADYVMVGSIFSKAIESSAPNYWKGIKLSPSLAKALFSKGFTIKKVFRGMSTKEAQKALGNTVLKTSEGVVRKYNAEYTLQKWTENFEHYLRSAMSYGNAATLAEFIGQSDYNIITENAFKRFNK